MTVGPAKLKTLYLILAIVGAIIPYAFFIQHFNESGFGIGRFVFNLFAFPASGGFAVDLVISSLVFWIAIFNRHSKGIGPRPWLFVALNLGIGLSCALLAYLYVNESRQQSAAT
jgi:hypothetical protein